MSGKHAAIVPPKQYKTNVNGRMVDVPPPGRYVHPTTGHQYILSGVFGFYWAGWGGSSGWPTFWHELVPVEQEIAR